MNSGNIITSPMEYHSFPKDRYELFLAGSIEMGRAEDWQSVVMVALQEYIASGKIRIFNPRRVDWNPEWSQDGENPELKKQIQWELVALERSDIILFYLQPGTLSPISLLEFGLHARSDKSLVICPPWFWRRANVVTTAEIYGVPMVSDLQEGIRKIIARIQW